MGGRPPSDVWGPVVIVGVEGPVECSGGGAVGPVGPDVGPFLEQGPVELFDLAVRLGSAGPDPHVLHAEFRQCLAACDGFGVGERVVCHHGLDVDAVCGEERVRQRVDTRAGVAGLVREDLAVRRVGSGHPARNG